MKKKYDCCINGHFGGNYGCDFCGCENCFYGCALCNDKPNKNLTQLLREMKVKKYTIERHLKYLNLIKD